MKPVEHGRALLTALALLTRWPWQPPFRWSEAGQRLSPAYYPLVGALLGLVLWGVYWLCGDLPSGLTAFVVLLLWVAMTGALHLDGLADAVDGYFAGHRCADSLERKDRILSVMRDPATGAMAVVMLVLVLLAKWLALEVLMGSALVASPLYWCVLLALPRAALLPILIATRYARSEGLAAGLNLETTPLSVWVALLLSIAAALWIGPAWPTAISLGWLVLLVWFWRRLWVGQIGGYTGDTLGGQVELAETLLLWFWAIALLTGHP
ncbi:adenosylcobinamide-GDP ribazoletransferase [Marinimicrobium locisalis]|uniref:adenosylcobinamide-GDP ribazoletransferase n=1 Tax=Marinimicrobium locisalis TaxID=546022 RepID=UPI003221D10B